MLEPGLEPDADREGEGIGNEITEVCREANSNLSVFRAKFSDITRDSVRRALDNLGQLDQNKINAVDVRGELDLRVGAAFTRLQTMHCVPNNKDQILHAGTCMTPTLGYICKRYREVESFVGKKLFNVVLTHDVHHQEGNSRGQGAPF